MLGIAAIPSLFLAIGILKMPESPRWLIMKGLSNDPEEAKFRLREIKKSIGIDENCDDDIVKIPDSVKSQGEGVWKELLLKPTKSLRWILIAGIGIHFFEHATGIEAVILYIGRRKLLLTSLSGMVVTLTGLGIFLTLAEHSGGKLIWALVLSIITTYGVVMFFNIGLGPVTWVYTAEIFPLKFRGLGVGIGVAVNRLMNATVSMTFLSISAAITTGGAFFMFAGISVMALIFFYFFLPETKGKSLEEMEAVFTCSKNVSKEVEIGKY
ncbi:hypothetical protein R3W88_004737 [Solanum pinnatisectum]|uniref:Major facilitator superfamily (MFS) profile domain-containing protein n=1 Tax=Solanum pinnatisectum TaxID=50273 RepID=A0AAV9KCC1_9SOLN|nr:hypothetical protein R3W88_004737 [Solanum pinnatisectum]